MWSYRTYQNLVIRPSQKPTLLASLMAVLHPAPRNIICVLREHPPAPDAQPVTRWNSAVDPLKIDLRFNREDSSQAQSQGHRGQMVRELFPESRTRGWRWANLAAYTTAMERNLHYSYPARLGNRCGPVPVTCFPFSPLLKRSLHCSYYVSTPPFYTVLFGGRELVL